MNRIVRILKKEIKRSVMGVETQIGSVRGVMTMPQLVHVCKQHIDAGKTVRVQIVNENSAGRNMVHLEAPNEGLRGLHKSEANDFSKVEETGSFLVNSRLTLACTSMQRQFPRA